MFGAVSGPRAGEPRCRGQSPAHLLEVGGGLDLPDRLHERVPDDDADVGAGVALGFAGELPQVGVVEGVRRVPQVDPEHLRSGRLLGQRDVDPLLKPERIIQIFTRLVDRKLDLKHLLCPENKQPMKPQQ